MSIVDTLLREQFYFLENTILCILKSDSRLRVLLRRPMLYLCEFVMSGKKLLAQCIVHKEGSFVSLCG